jgi:transposase
VAVPHLREAPVLAERTCVGLDVHARSVVGCMIDDESGEVVTLRLSPKPEAIVAWVRSLPGPVAVAYEAGPTGFGLARALAAAGVRCEVVAPSKMGRPPGDRIKTDRRDAERLARLLRIGELPGVRVPSQTEEAARDLVRAREDARGDLMRARHRLSKLLLRQGLVWDNGAWTGAHEAWLRTLRFDRVGVQLAFDGDDREPSTRCSACTRAGTGWMPRSPRWRPPACSRRSWTACVACAGSAR